MTNITKIKKSFKDKSLLTIALTHKSWVNENKGKREDNERLEFLGDAILEYIVSDEIFSRYPKKEEGYLTTLRAKLVNTDSLARVSKKLGVGKYLYLSKGEDESGGRENPSLLANTFEALIGALYFDQGIEKVKELISVNLLSNLPSIVKKPLKDAKSRLQEKVQAKGFPAPRYEVIKEVGPDHAKQFTIEVIINGKASGRGKGHNKSEAAQDAATKTLKKFL